MKAFIVHAWNFKPASLYPYRCDGVEYVDSVIRTIERVFADTGDVVAIDSKSFFAGETIRNNLEGQLRDSQLIIVLLDGLRPNVVYEMGYAVALNKAKILCLCEKDATVLVRNYYSNPLGVPTIKGTLETIENPRLDISSAFSDCSDILLMKYDRFNLDDLYAELKKYIANIKSSSLNACAVQKAIHEDGFEDQELAKDEGEDSDCKAKDDVSADNSPSSEKYRRLNVWELFKQQKYNEIEQLETNRLCNYGKKTKALTYFVQKKFSKAIEIFSLLIKEKGGLKSSSAYFLGVCYLAQERYFEAFVNLLHAKKLGYRPKSGSVDELLDACASYVDFEEWNELFRQEKIIHGPMSSSINATEMVENQDVDKLPKSEC